MGRSFLRISRRNLIITTPAAAVVSTVGHSAFAADKTLTIGVVVTASRSQIVRPGVMSEDVMLRLNVVEGKRDEVRDQETDLGAGIQPSVAQERALFIVHKASVALENADDGIGNGRHTKNLFQDVFSVR